jgi:hypothetical protein
MSMPGFVFHFHCDSCGATSDEFSMYVFHDIFRPDIGLPAWSMRHKCWAYVQAELSVDQRREMEFNRDVLLAFAASLSSDNFTVGVPQMSLDEAGKIRVDVLPDPRCPYCGKQCKCVTGYPPNENATTPPLETITAVEFRAMPLASIGLSVRTSIICRDLGIQTLGQLEDRRDQLVAHPRTSDVVLDEIERWLKRKPAST